MDLRIDLQLGDITSISVDAIVNAANKGLAGGGGVDGAIHRVGGPAIMEELNVIRAEIRHLETGEAVITTAGKLPANFVIHTVGPIYNPQEHAEMERLLANCYTNSLKLAVDKGCKSVSFPGISTGVYRYPKHLAAKTALENINQFLAENESIEKVVVVCFDYSNFRYYQNYMKG